MFGVVVAQYSKLDFKARFCADNAVKPQTAHKAKSAILFFIKVYLNFPISIILNVVSKGAKQPQTIMCKATTDNKTNDSLLARDELTMLFSYATISKNLPMCCNINVCY